MKRLKEVEKVILKKDAKEDKRLIDLYKILSAEHLLKKPFANDSNSLDTKFYTELLHIIGLEEKKDGASFKGRVDSNLLMKAEERELNTAINAAASLAHKAIDAEDFEGAMKAVAKLRAPVDAFFEHVIVNDTNRDYRDNRLRLLNRIREATAEVADFSKIEG